MEGGRHLPEVSAAARGPAPLCLLRGSAHRQREAGHPSHPGPRVQGPVRPLQDDAGLLRRAKGRLGHARPPGRDRGREETQHLGQVPDPSVYIRFRLKNDPRTSILAWTTTPWTLPGNVALAVDNDIDYIKVHEGGEFLILAETLLSVLKEPPQVVERMKGRDLLGLE